MIFHKEDLSMQQKREIKKTYEAPMAEKVEFHYSDQVVASGVNPMSSCMPIWINFGLFGCEGDSEQYQQNN